MRLFPRLLVIFLTLTLVPLGFVGTLVFINARIHIQDSMVHSLEAIADFSVGRVENFISGQRQELESLRSLALIRKQTAVLKRHLNDRSSAEFTKATDALDDHFENYHVHSHKAMVLYDDGGRLIYTDSEAWNGMLGLKPEGAMEESFGQGSKGFFFGPVFKDVQNAFPGMWISAPVMAGEKLLGVVAMQINLRELLEKLAGRRGLGESGEVLLGLMQQDEALFLTRLRHYPDTPFLSKSRALPITRAASGKDGKGISQDYRGRQVIAVWRHISAPGWGLVVKIDTAEALHPIYELRRIALLVGLIALLFGMLMAWVMARSISVPVRKLARGAAMVGAGNLDYRLDMPGEGEFSDLAASFNMMAADMKKVMDERGFIMAELAASEERFRTMVASLTGVVYSCRNDQCRTVEFVSAGIESITGAPVSDFLNGSQNLVKITHPNDLERVRQAILNAVRNAEPYLLEYRIVDAGTNVHWVLDRGQVAVHENRPVLLNGVMIDISGQKRAEEELRASYRKLKQSQDASFNIMEDLEHQRDALRKALEEREVLLREIHHRVKNNMQIISAMLELQAGYTTDSQVHEFFKDSQARIKSMALVHEKLYRLESLSRIDFGEYIKDLVDSIMLQYPGVLENSAVNIDAGNIMLSIDKAIPCGLIVNELVSNIFKHAFPDKRRGKVEISMREDENSAIILTVKDNGIGLPKDLDIHSGKTFGMYIVHSLAERQLGGTIKTGNRHGASFVIRFGKEDLDE